MIRDIVLLSVFPAAMALAAVSDLLSMTIPNRLSLALAAGFFLAAALIGMPFAQVGWHVAAGMTVLVAAFGLFAAGWIGGGDAKFAAATALWLGFPVLLEYFLIASLFGGAMTLVLLRARAWPLPGVLAGTRWIERLHAPETGIPYGIALAAAGLLVYPHTIFLRALAS
jgi:prepilin peptidase CpaA